MRHGDGNFSVNSDFAEEGASDGSLRNIGGAERCDPRRRLGKLFDHIWTAEARDDHRLRQLQQSFYNLYLFGRKRN